MIRVLFVCFGNICRSPMAEAIFQRLVDQADLALLQAGKSVRHIRRVEKHLKRTLRGLGIYLQGP